MPNREYWDYVREAYKKFIPAILRAAKANRRGKVDPYLLDWVQFFSPIESAAWNSIRAIGIPLYPQFPALRYFIDFANPYLRIGLELDGTKWHDVAKDKIRDQELYDREGWRIFRIPGKEAIREFEPIYEGHDCADDPALWSDRTFREKLSTWLVGTADGVISSIDHVYFRDLPDAYGGTCQFSLQMHNLLNFELLEGHAVWKPDNESAALPEIQNISFEELSEYLRRKGLEP